MVSADSTAQSQLLFVIEKIKGKRTLCGCSMVDYLDREHYKVRGPNLGWVLIRDTSSFSPFFQAALTCS